jgi:SAM-dependent methyltransferase
MGFRTALRDWEYLAKKDALWAILSEPSKRKGRWEPDEFFARGEAEIARTFRFLEREKIVPVDFESAVDFGCGVGRLARALASRFAKVYGIDAAPTMIERGRELNAALPNLELVLNQEPRLGRFADGSISFVYTTLVLQHITYPESLAYVRELLRILKPGGVAVIQTPTLDRLPRPLRMARALVRTVLRRLRLPLAEGWYMEMNAIPGDEIARAAAALGCEIAARFDNDRFEISADGMLSATGAGESARMVSERFVIRKKLAR